VSAPPARLILWDIDGTLLSAGAVARTAFDAAVESVIGRHPGDHGISMSGKTDPLIAREILENAGVSPRQASALMPEVLAALERELRNAAEPMRSDGKVHPGVRRILRLLDDDPLVLQSVLTGNLEANARAKLAAFGLDGFFDLDVGAFGSDHHDRLRLVAIALDRVRQRRGWLPDPSDVWIVGDTERDLLCARAAGARCFLVGTGRFPLDQLAGLGADHVLADLGDVEGVLSVLRP